MVSGIEAEAPGFWLIVILGYDPVSCGILWSGNLWSGVRWIKDKAPALKLEKFIPGITVGVWMAKSITGLKGSRPVLGLSFSWPGILTSGCWASRVPSSW
jgi:hypothetical protein